MDTTCLGRMQWRPATSDDFGGSPILELPKIRFDSCRLFFAFLATMGVELAHRLAFELGGPTAYPEQATIGVRLKSDSGSLRSNHFFVNSSGEANILFVLSSLQSLVKEE